MSLSFACPSCKAQIEVPDELAGQTGQCPRCQHVFTVPRPQQGGGKPVFVGKTKPGETSIPPTDPWADQDKPKPKPLPGKAERPRRVRSVPAAPSGPIWPWFVGIFGALVVGGLLLSSFIVLVSWRQPPPIDPRLLIQAPMPPGGERVIIGRLEGRRAFMDNGVFQVRSELTANDPRQVLPVGEGPPYKRYQIELRAWQHYVIDQDSNQIDCSFHVEDPNGQDLGGQGGRGIRNAQMTFIPRQNQQYVIHVTSFSREVRPGLGPMQPTFGSFTLTVREQGRLKPFVP